MNAQPAPLPPLGCCRYCAPWQAITRAPHPRRAGPVAPCIILSARERTTAP